MESDTFSFLNPERRHVMLDEVLTIKEAAALLKLAEKTVYAMAQAGEIPAFKIRGQWRITRTDFDRWLASQSRGSKDGGGPHGR